MKVYIVLFQIDYEGSQIRKIFDSFEKAEQYMIQNQPADITWSRLVLEETEVE